MTKRLPSLTEGIVPFSTPGRHRPQVHPEGGCCLRAGDDKTEDRLAERNGTRPKLLATKAGDVELRIPKLRKGSFFPSILEPRRRIDQALYAVVTEA